MKQDSLNDKKRHRPGGFKCPCCNAWGVHPRHAKPLESRYMRRKAKFLLKNLDLSAL